MASAQLVLGFLFALFSLLNAQYLLDPYAAPVYAAPYYGYVYGSNRPGGEQPKPDNSNEKQQMGFIPNPLDPANANRQFPPMMPGQNPQQSGPPAFPSPVIPQQQSAENTMQSSTMAAPAAKNKKL